jgi:hypothetical protein
MTVKPLFYNRFLQLQIYNMIIQENLFGLFETHTFSPPPPSSPCFYKADSVQLLRAPLKVSGKHKLWHISPEQVMCRFIKIFPSPPLFKIEIQDLKPLPISNMQSKNSVQSTTERVVLIQMRAAAASLVPAQAQA